MLQNLVRRVSLKKITALQVTYITQATILATKPSGERVSSTYKTFFAASLYCAVFVRHRICATAHEICRLSKLRSILTPSLYSRPLDCSVRDPTISPFALKKMG